MSMSYLDVVQRARSSDRFLIVMPQVPDTLEEALSPSWVTAALAPRFPGVVVTNVVPGPIISRMSTNARFRIECRGGAPEGLPIDLCIKGYFGEAGRAARHAGEPEVRFYRDLAASVAVRTLQTFYADVDPESRHGVLITADVVAQGGRFLDALSAYSTDQVAESLGLLAELHAKTWQSAKWADAPWLAPRMTQLLLGRGVPEIRHNFDSSNGVGVPPEVRDPERLVAAYRALATEVESLQAWTVMHGDTHVGNLFLDPAGRPALLDWQLVQRGAWYIDVGYHIASSLPVEERRRSERDLLRHYLECLAAAGAQAPSWDDAWDGLRRGVLHGFYLWGITLKVEPAIIAVLLERLGTAAADNDSLAIA